jgi:hypothetical protein
MNATATYTKNLTVPRPPHSRDATRRRDSSQLARGLLPTYVAAAESLNPRGAQSRKPVSTVRCSTGRCYDLGGVYLPIRKAGSQDGGETSGDRQAARGAGAGFALGGAEIGAAGAEAYAAGLTVVGAGLATGGLALMGLGVYTVWRWG